MKCRICNNKDNNKEYYFKEMMLGLEENFLYFQCSKCNCLQINEFPKDISKYYPKNYYSFSPFNKRNKFKKLVKTIKDNHALFNKGWIGKLLYCIRPNKELRGLMFLNLTKNDQILDVGCGSGYLLYSLKELGFKSVMGADPFIKKNIVYLNGLKIVKKNFQELDKKWDLIMFHHSFEHMSNPVETIKYVSEKLTDRGRCLIRIPTVSSYAWDHYKKNWVAIDAPRHFFIHSKESIAFLADQFGLCLKHVKYDSNAMQFWASEQYLAGISLMSEKSYAQNPKKSMFTKTQIKEFEKKAKLLNKNKQGDQVAFVLTRK